MFKQLLVASLAASTFACTATDATMDELDPAADEGSGDTDATDPADPGPCTPDTDVVPMLDIAAVMETSPAGDIERGEDGALYFVTHVGTQDALIGRRVPCGDIEADWLSISAPIVDLEVSSDNQLYMAGHGAGTVEDISARIYRLDLGDGTAFPENLVREPGQVIRALGAAPDGRVYFIAGFGSFWIRYIDGYEVQDVLPTALYISSPAALSVTTQGELWIAGSNSGQPAIGKVSFSSTGVPSMTVKSAPFEMREVRADNADGYYAVKAAPLQSKELFHASSHAAAPVSVPGGTVPAGARFGFNVTGDMGSIVTLVPGSAPEASEISLTPSLAPR